MTITFRCPTCHNRFRIDDEMRGQKVRCPGPQCRSIVLIPNTDVTTRSASGKSGKITQSLSESGSTSAAAPRPVASSSSAISRLSKQQLIGGGAVLFVLSVAALGAALMSISNSVKDPFADLVSRTVPQDTLPTDSENEATLAREHAEEKRRDQEERERQAKLTAEEAAKRKTSDERMGADKLAADQQAERLRQEAMEAQENAARDAAIGEDSPFSFIRTNQAFHDSYGQWLFELPSPEENLLSEPLPLRTQGLEVELSLCDAAEALFKDSLTQLELLRSPDADRTWLVRATQAGTKVELGEYTLEAIASADSNPETPDHQLSFRWRRDAAREILAAELLRWWPLQISVGDRSAVLLQRSTYVSDVPLKWDSLVNGQKIVFPRSSEIQSIDQTPNELLSFCIEIKQIDAVPQTLCMNLGPVEVEQDDPEPVDTAAFSLTNFALRLPVEFQETAPDLQESPLGFGTLQLQATRTPEHGLTVQPKLELALRLPGKRHLETFPGEETHQAFIVVAREPEQIRNLGSSTSLRNIAKEMIQTTRDNHEFWHRQPLRTIAKKSSFEPAFMDHARGSMKTTQQVVRTAERDANAARTAVVGQQRKMAVIAAQMEAGGGVGLARTLDAAEDALVQLQAKMRQAETRLEAVKRLEPDIDEYCLELKQLIDEFTEQNASLLQDFDEISLKVEELLDASKTGAFQLRGEMSAGIPIPHAENGPTMCIRFIEASTYSVE
jgi:hypothetical protein